MNETKCTVHRKRAFLYAMEACCWALLLESGSSGRSADTAWPGSARDGSMEAACGCVAALQLLHSQLLHTRPAPVADHDRQQAVQRGVVGRHAADGRLTGAHNLQFPKGKGRAAELGFLSGRFGCSHAADGGLTGAHNLHAEVNGRRAGRGRTAGTKQK